MNHQEYENKEFCYYHPKQGLNGVCPFCLNEKLLIVEANQAHLRRHQDSGKKMFGFGSLFNRRRRRRSYAFHDDASDDDHTISTSTTLEDSFISIKFEENGVALWDNSKDECSNKNEHVGSTKEASWRSSSNKSVVLVEHAKSSTRVSLRWRKRIGHLLNLVKLKRFRNLTQRR